MQADKSCSFSPCRWSSHPLSLSPPPFLCALLRRRTWNTEGLRLAELQFSHLLHCWVFSLLCFHNCWAVSSGFAAHTYAHASFQQVLFISSELLWHIFNTWHFWLSLRLWNTKTHGARVAVCWKSIGSKSLQRTKVFGIDWGLFFGVGWGGEVRGHHMAAIKQSNIWKNHTKLPLFTQKRNKRQLVCRRIHTTRQMKEAANERRRGTRKKQTNKALAINCA